MNIQHSKYKKNSNFIFFIIIAFLGFTKIVGQDINKDVTVTKAYKPVVADAKKINQLPTFNDTVNIKPEINYTLSTIKVNSVYTPRPVNAAKLVPDELEPLQNGYVRLGLGIPLNPLVEVYINNTRNKTDNVGFYAGFESMSGKAKLGDNNRVNAGYNNSKALLFGKHNFSTFILGGELGYTGNKNTFYGATDISQYNTLNHDVQQYNTGNLKVYAQSNQTDSNKLYFKVNSETNYLTDRFYNSENSFVINGNAAQNINGFYSGANVQLQYYGQSTVNKSAYNSIFELSPFIGKSNSEWSYKAGFRLMPNFATVNGGMHFYPFANLNFNVVQKVMAAYVGLNGNLEANPLLNLSTQNPYLQPGLSVKNTNNRACFYGGIKGDISSAVNFNLQANYSIIDNMYFWINNTQNSNSSNRFIVEYANVELLKLTGEINIKPSDKIDWYNSVNFYNYTLTGVDKAWHKPTLDFKSDVKYNLQNKILVNAALYGMFGRYARGSSETDAIALNPVIDFNLAIEYRYTKPLSVFLRINNLLANRYQIYYNYPSYRFQVMCGFTYSL